MVQALFIDPKGIYPKLLGAANCWDEERDARAYSGTEPVVAHPPCNLWTNMAAVNWKRYRRQRPAWQGGDDGGCFRAAMVNVLLYGGVVEHPAHTHAWAHYGIPKPVKDRWTRHLGGWICSVWQHAYGHGAEKDTWLFYSGDRPPFELNWERNPETVTHHCGHDAKWRTNKKRLEKRHASATPEAFARELIRLAEWSRG